LSFLLDLLAVLDFNIAGFGFSEFCKIIAAFITVALCCFPIIFRAKLATALLCFALSSF